MFFAKRKEKKRKGKESKCLRFLKKKIEMFACTCSAPRPQTWNPWRQRRLSPGAIPSTIERAGRRTTRQKSAPRAGGRPSCMSGARRRLRPPRHDSFRRPPLQAAHARTFAVAMAAASPRRATPVGRLSRRGAGHRPRLRGGGIRFAPGTTAPPS